LANAFPEEFKGIGGKASPNLVCGETQKGRNLWGSLKNVLIGEKKRVIGEPQKSFPFGKKSPNFKKGYTLGLGKCPPPKKRLV